MAAVNIAQPQQVPPQQYIVPRPQYHPHVIANTAQPAQPALIIPHMKVKYAKSHISSVKGLALSQLVLGIGIIICHVFTTAINDHFNNQVAMLSGKLGGFYFYGFSDSAATGVWVGLLIIVAACIGVAGYKQQKKSLIITHLVLNIFLILGLIALISTVSSNLDALVSCRKFGQRYYDDNRDFSYYYYSNYYGYYTATTATYYLLGEAITGTEGSYYCLNGVFRLWLVLDAIILTFTLFVLFVTVALIAYNSIASCGCCRNCCASNNYRNDNEDGAVSYNAQPSRPVYPTNQLQAFPQVQATPQLYAQHGPVSYPMVHQPTMVPQQGAAMFVHQPAAVMAQQPATIVDQQPNVMFSPPGTAPPMASAPQAGASNPDGKWEQSPPDYTAATQSYPR